MVGYLEYSCWNPLICCWLVQMCHLSYYLWKFHFEYHHFVSVKKYTNDRILYSLVGSKLKLMSLWWTPVTMTLWYAGHFDHSLFHTFAGTRVRFYWPKGSPTQLGETTPSNNLFTTHITIVRIEVPDLPSHLLTGSVILV